MSGELTVKIFNEVGEFAEDKDKAQQIRVNQILTALDNGNAVVLDFENVNSATQSFVHALISDAIRLKGIEVLDEISFKNCNEVVRGIIEIVVDYMQDPLGIAKEKPV